jgi:two-component system nitrate/nitrite response regulator NarL
VARRIRVVIVDDNPASLQTWESLLQNDFNIVAKVKDGVTALEAIRTCEPDVAVLDFEMPGLSGIEVTRAALRDHPTLAVVICSLHRNPVSSNPPSKQVQALTFAR